MEYHRTEKGQIYADIAYRLGRIVCQYEKLSIDEDKFEATLYIAVLQNLLTNCCEHFKQMAGQSAFFKENIESVGWGLRKRCWVENKYKEDMILENFIKRLRNAISHPTELYIDRDYPSTGYTTIKDNSGLIKKYRFFDSPDTRWNRLLGFTEEERIKEYIRRNQNTFPSNIHYYKNGSKYILSINSEPFARISIIDLYMEELSAFVKNLANYLAQPIQENWDGKTINWLLAA